MLTLDGVRKIHFNIRKGKKDVHPNQEKLVPHLQDKKV